MNQLDDNAARRSNRSCLAIVLAAGEGTRMRSAKPKVLHEIAGRSMLAHVLALVGAAGAGRVAVVIGPDRDDVAREARKVSPGAEVFEQQERLGTAHAVLAAESALRAGRRQTSSSPSPTPLWSRRRPSPGCGSRSPTAWASPCSGSRRAIRPATAA